jgi:hypothetical protein
MEMTELLAPDIEITEAKLLAHDSRDDMETTGRLYDEQIALSTG